VEEVQEVVGVVAGGVEADGEGDGRVAAGEVLEAAAELGVAVGRLGEEQLGGGGLEVLAQEGGVVAVAGGVNTDTDAGGRAGGRGGGGVAGGHNPSKKMFKAGQAARALRRGRTRRKLVMRGQRLKM
jgi:hypothetical protein